MLNINNCILETKYDFRILTAYTVTKVWSIYVKWSWFPVYNKPVLFSLTLVVLLTKYTVQNFYKAKQIIISKHWLKESCLVHIIWSYIGVTESPLRNLLHLHIFNWDINARLIWNQFTFQVLFIYKSLSTFSLDHSSVCW